MRYIVEFFIFIIICFLYIHVFYHLKTSNALEVYVIDDCSKEKFEEICNLRQPFVYTFPMEDIDTYCNQNHILEQYGSFDMQLRNVIQSTSREELYMLLKSKEVFQLCNTQVNNSTAKYISENNSEFLHETELVKRFQENDLYLRPSFVFQCTYDYMCGSENSKTPWRYNLAYRSFLYVSSGSIKLKVSPPKYAKYMHCVYDYENFEFRSPMDPWNPNATTQSQYEDSFDKIKCMDIEASQGTLVFIPAYWWYSIQYDSPQTSVCKFQYYTYMNNISILPQYVMWILQRQNIRHTIDLYGKPEVTHNNHITSSESAATDSTNLDSTNLDPTSSVHIQNSNTGTHQDGSKLTFQSFE